MIRHDSKSTMRIHQIYLSFLFVWHVRLGYAFQSATSFSLGKRSRPYQFALFESSPNIQELLDRAVVLYEQSRSRDEPLWLADQIESLIEKLAGRIPAVEAISKESRALTDESRSVLAAKKAEELNKAVERDAPMEEVEALAFEYRQLLIGKELAVQLEESILGGAPFEEVEALSLQYRQLLEGSKFFSTEGISQELEAIDKQLTSFEEILKISYTNERMARPESATSGSESSIDEISSNANDTIDDHLVENVVDIDNEEPLSPADAKTVSDTSSSPHFASIIAPDLPNATVDVIGVLDEEKGDETADDDTQLESALGPTLSAGSLKDTVSDENVIVQAEEEQKSSIDDSSVDPISASNTLPLHETVVIEDTVGDAKPDSAEANEVELSTESISMAGDGPTIEEAEPSDALMTIEEAAPSIMKADADVPPTPDESSDKRIDEEPTPSFGWTNEADVGIDNNIDIDIDDEVSEKKVDDSEPDVVDVAIVGAGLGGLCAGAILNTHYGKKVGIYESHYLAGGCAHAFDRKAPNGVTFTFDSGPSILLGCSSPPFNALQQVLSAVGQDVEWIPYDGWGMIENPGKETELRWKVQLGPNHFENGPITQFGGERALDEFNQLRATTKGLLAGAAIPAMAMRSGSSALIPLLRYFPTLLSLLQQGEVLTGTFSPYMDGPLFKVTDPWLRSWLDALAFSLSGLPASRTAAAAMAFVLNDMHRPGAALDYPRGGLGTVVDALVRGVEQGNHGSQVHLRRHVTSIDCSPDGLRITGLTLKNGKKVIAKDGVVCNAPVWTLNQLIQDDRVKKVLNKYRPLTDRRPPMTWLTTSEEGSSIRMVRPTVTDDKESFLAECDTAEMTGSFLHLHLAIDIKGLNVDALEAHYTVMDRSLQGNGSIVNGIPDGPCGALNMIAVSNPCVLDKTLAPEGYMVLHAYGAANEPYELYEGMDRSSVEYQEWKEERAAVLWRAVESIIPNVRDRVVYYLIGSPLTHERFLRRPKGSYGSATEDYLKDASTPYETLWLASDGVFPGIGLPSVAIAGASAANSLVSVGQHWKCLDQLKRHKKL